MTGKLTSVLGKKETAMTKSGMVRNLFSYEKWGNDVASYNYYLVIYYGVTLTKDCGDFLTAGSRFDEAYIDVDEGEYTLFLSRGGTTYEVKLHHEVG